MAQILTVVLGTSNPGKVRELAELFPSAPVRLVSVKDVLGRSLEIVEDGLTFEENARIKARAVSRATGLVALADDSGLEVDALEGRPGVYSARFAGDGARDSENNQKLLAELRAVPFERRTARFRCVLALVSPHSAEELLASGSCEGQIAEAPRGEQGFGYDPLFVVSGFSGHTMAELSQRQKNSVSHRARAAQALQELWLPFIRAELLRSSG